MQDLSKYAMPGAKSEYTVTLGELVALGYDTDDKLHLSAEYYPIFDETHRAELNEKIVRHYALREIGQETAQQFVFYFGMTMAEIMPYFNERYRSAALEYDPLTTMDTTTDSATGSESQSSSKATSSQDSTTTSTSTTSNQSATTSKSYDSDVPATGVVGDFARYASHANEATADTNGTSESSQDSSGHVTASSATDYSHGSTTGKGTSHTTGRTTSGAALVQAYRQAIINVDMEIIQSLEPCFMQLWGSYDTIFSKVYDC